MTTFMADAAEGFAEQSPIEAARAFARGLQPQTPGGRLSALREAVRAMLAYDASLARRLRAELLEETKP